MTKFEGAIVSLIYICSPRELCISKYLRDQFYFLTSVHSFKRVLDEASKNPSARRIGFIRNIGYLRVGVKEHWHQIIKSFESIEKMSSLNFFPLIPVYAVSNRPFYVELNHPGGTSEHLIGRVVVSIYPLYSFSIRLVFKVDIKVSEKELILLLKQIKNEGKILYKGLTFNKPLEFAVRIKLWTLQSIFKSDKFHLIRAKLSKENQSIYLKGNIFLGSPEPIVGISLLNEQYDKLSKKIVERYEKRILQFYDNDYIVSSEKGTVAYSPLLERVVTPLHKKRFRRSLFIATELAFVVKSFLKRSVEFLSFSIKNDITKIHNIVLNTFVTGNPTPLSRHEYHTGLLKPHELQKIFESVALILDLYGLYMTSLNSMKKILAHVLIPDLVDIYDKIRCLQLMDVNSSVECLYQNAVDLKIPRIIEEVEKLFPKRYASITVKTLDFLIKELKKEYKNIWENKLDANKIGWRTIKDIIEGLSSDKKNTGENARKENINRDLFYPHKGKHLPGIIKLLELYNFVEIKKIPSRGRKGFTIKVRANPSHPAIDFVLNASGINLSHKNK